MIRAINATDLHTLHRMICETIDASYSELYPPRAVDFFKEHHSEKKIAERSAVGEILVLISERDGSILATGSLIESEIIGVFVHPDHQGQGYGKAIMTQLEQIAIGKEFPKLSLSISLPSRQFYEHLGYKVLDECVLDVGGGEYLKYWSGKKELHPRDRQKVNMATVEIVKTAGDAAELDELLWRVLWQPLGLPRDIRNNFNIDGEKLELTANENGKIVGGLAALVAELCRIASIKMYHRIHTIAPSRETHRQAFSEQSDLKLHRDSRPSIRYFWSTGSPLNF